MSNPNTVTVYDPKGEAFEMTVANARDLVAHRGWSKTKPHVIIRDAEPAAEPAVEPVAEPVVEEEKAEDEEASEAEAPFTTAEQFADLTEREDLVAYLDKHFPDFKPHHKAGRDSLVEKAVELANA